MAVAYLKQPRVYNPSLQTSNIYARSAFRPYAGLFQGSRSTATDLLDQQIIRSISSPFSINDQNVINAIRRQHGIVDDGSYQMSRQIGGAAGAIAGVGISALLFKGAAASALTMNPVGMGVSLALVALGVIGTTFTSMHLGEVIGASIGSKEGQIAGTQYLTNLGNSFVRRPIGTALKTITMITVPMATAKLGVTSPYLTQGITMLAMRGVSWVGDLADNAAFGELSEQDAMSYTDLMSLQGDLADNISGTTILKAIAASIPDQDNFSDLLAKAYGVHEEGFDPLDFNDVREAFDVDAGTFGNMAIDILGEILIDADNLGGAIKRSYENKVLDPVKKQIRDDVDFKDLNDKQVERIAKEILKEYQIAKKGMSLEEVRAIEIQNKLLIEKVITPFLVQELKKGYAEKTSEDNLKTIETFDKLKTKIEDSFKVMIGDIEGVFTTLGEIGKKANENKDKLNPDVALMKDMDLGKYNPDSKRMKDLYNGYNTFRLYSDANDFQMQVISYFTKPFQSVIRTKFVQRKMNQVLTKIKNFYDPIKKVTDEIEGTLTTEDIKKQKEIYAEYEKKSREYVDKIRKDAIQKKILEDSVKKNPKYTSFNAIEAELKKLKDQLKDAEGDHLKALEDQIKPLQKQFNEMQNELLEDWNKTPLARRIKEIDEKFRHLYKDLKALENYGKNVEYRYYSDGQEVRRSIHDEKTLKEAGELVKVLNEELLSPKTNRSRESVLKEKEIIESKIKEYVAQESFRSQNMELIGLYNNVYRFIETNEIQYAIIFDAFKRLQKGYNKIQSEIKKSKKTLAGDPTQDQTEQDIKDTEKILKFKMDETKATLEEIAKDLGLPENIVNDIIKQITEDKLKFRMHPASTVFDVMKDLLTENDFFNSKPALFNALNELFLLKEKNVLVSEGEEPKSLIEVLQNIQTHKSGKIKNKSQKEYLAAAKYITEFISKQSKEKYNGSLSEQEISHINENIVRVIQSWAHLANMNKAEFEKQLKDEDHKGEHFDNIYFVQDFFLLNNTNMQNLVLSFVAKNLMTDVSLKDIDENLEIIQSLTRKQIEFYKESNSPIEKELVEQIRRRMFQLKNSKLLYAVNSRFNKKGILSELFHSSDINLNTFNFSEIDPIIKDIEKLEVEASNIVGAFENYIDEELNKPGTEKEYDAIKQRLEKSSEIKDMSKVSSTGNDVYDIIKNMLEIKDGDASDPKLNNERFNEFIKKIYKIHLDLEKRKNDMKAAASKSLQIREDIKSKNKINPLLRFQLESDILALTNPSDISSNRRGQSKQASKHKIDTDQFDGSLLQTYMKNIEGEITAHDVRLLILKSSNNRFVNRNGVEVELKSINQIPIESIPNNWVVAMHKPYEATEENAAFLEFFKNQSQNEEGKYDEYQQRMVSTPYQIRDSFENKRTEEQKNYDRTEEIKLNADGDLEISEPDSIGDIEKQFLKRMFQQSEQIESIEILHSEKNTDNKYKFVIDDGSGKESEVMVVRVQQSGKNGKLLQYYIPIATKNQLGVQETETQKEQIREYETYKIGGETYLRRKIYKNETVIREVFDDIFQSDINRLNDEHFKPLSSNRSIFHTYYGNEPILGTNENFSNLMWLDPNRTRMADIILSDAYYLTQKQLESLYKDPDKFIEMLNKEGFDIEISQSNVTFVTKRPLVYDGESYKEVSFLKLYNVGFDKIENPGRHGIGTMNAKNAKIYLNENGETEKPYLQNSLFKPTEENKPSRNAWLEESGGFNAITALVNMNFRFGKNGPTFLEILQTYGNGATTFEDGAIMSESAFLKYFGASPDQRRPVKIVDRYSNKGSVTVVPDKVMILYKEQTGLKEAPEVLLSEHGTGKRNLYATLFEMQNTRSLVGENKKETVYVDHGKLSHNTIGTTTEEQEKYGYLYLYKMEIGDGKSKATQGYDTITRNSMSISHEDLQVLSSLSYIKDIKDGLGKIIDEEGILFDEIKKVAKTYQPSQDYELTGKNSITAEQFRWHLPYSNSMVIKNNSKLKSNQISVPVHVLVEMGLGKIVNGIYVPNETQGSKEVLIMRRPTKGRESIVYAEIVPSDDKYDFAIGIPASMTAAPNADFDYDGMQFFAMVGFSDKARSIAKKAFSHRYTEKSNMFNDMDEVTMEKYNMDKLEEKIILDEKNNQKVETKKEFIHKEEDLANWNKNVLEKTNFVKQETPRVRDYTDVLYDRFYTNTNPNESKDSNVLFDEFLRNEKYKNLLSSESIKKKYGKLDLRNLRTVKVQSFEHLRRMILDSTTQLTVDFGKHGLPWMKRALGEVTKVLFDEYYLKRLDDQLKIASFIIPKFYVITQMSESEKLKVNGIEMDKVIDKIITDAKNAFKNSKLVINEELINPADYNRKVNNENETSALVKESEKTKEDFIEAELKSKGVSPEEMKDYKEAVQAASDRKSLPAFEFDLNYNLKTMGTIDGLGKEVTDIRDQLQNITLRTKHEVEGTKGKTAFDILKDKLQVFLLNTLKDSVKGDKVIYVEVDGKKWLLEDIFKFKDNFGGSVIENAQAALLTMKVDGSARIGGEFNERFDFKDVKSFKLISDDYATHRQINMSLEKHWIKFQKEVADYLELIDIDRRFSIRPDIQNGIIHQTGLVSNLLQDIYLGTNTSRIGMIIRETGKENPFIKDKVKSIFKNFHLYQSVLSYLSGDEGLGKAKRSNIVSEIALMENIFNNELQLYTDYSKLDPTYTRALLIQTGFLDKGETIQQFYEKYNLRDKQDILDFLNVVEIIKDNIHKTKFLGNMQKVQNYEGIKLLMSRVISLRKNGIKSLGRLFEQSNDENNLYTQNDLNLLKYDEIGDDKIDDYLEIVYKISSVVGQKTQNPNLRDSLNKEVMEISQLKAATSLVSAELIRHSFTDAYYINQSGENGKFGVFQNDPALSDNMIIIKNNELNKYNRDVISRWYDIVTPFDIKRVDSPNSKLRKEERELRLAQDISTLMVLDKTSPLNFSDEIYKEMNHNKKRTNVSNGLMNMLYFVNKIYGQINNNQPAISFIELINVLEKVKYERAEIIDPDTKKVKEVPTGKAFSNYIHGLEQQLLNEKGINITEFLSKFEHFVGYETEFSNQMHRNPEPFVREIIGRIFYERNTAGSMFNKDKNLPTRQKFMDTILKDLNDIQTKKDGLTNNTSYSLTRNILDGISKPEDITKNKSASNQIAKKVEEYKNRPTLIEASKNNVVDTYEIVSKSYGDESKREITTFSLFNIYSEFSGFHEKIKTILDTKDLTYKQKEEAIQAAKSLHYKELRDEIVREARKTNPKFKFKGAARLHTALIDSYINLKVVEYLVENIDKITDNESNVKELLTKFADPEQRENFIIFDTENNINKSGVKKFYELSYIIFDNKGNPIFKQMFFPDGLEETTLRWLKESKVWSDGDIKALEKEIGTSDFGKLKRELSEFVELIKDKTIIGQAVKGSEEQAGEIDKINALVENLYAKDVQKVVDKHNEQDKEFLKLNEMPNEAEYTKILNDTTNPQHLKDFKKHLIELEKQRVNKLLGRTGEVIYHEAYKEYEEKISTLLEVILEANDENDDSVVIQKIKTLFNLTDEQANAIFNAYKTELKKIKNEGVIREKVPKLIIEDDMIKIGYDEYDSLESYAIKEDPNSNFSKMLFKQNAFHMIRDTLRKTILVNQQSGYEYRMTLGQLEKYSYISPEFDTFVRESKINRSKLSDNMKILLDLLENQNPDNVYEYLKIYHRARTQFESENNKKILEDANLFEDTGETLFGEKTIKVNEDRLREVMLDNPTISKQQFSRLVTEKINELQRDILQRTKVDMDKILKTRINSLVYRANLFEFNDLDSDAEITLLADLLSLDKQETTKIYDEFKRRYLGYKDPDNKHGIKFNFFSGNEQENGILYDENIDYIFKEQALRDIIYGDASTLYVHLKVQDEFYKEYKQEHKPYESAYESEKEYLNDHARSKVNENETNKQIWSDAKSNLRTIVLESALNGDWKSLEDYIDKHPGFNKDQKQKMLSDFKKKFSETFDRLKISGIDHRINEPYFNKKTNRFEDLRPSGKKYEYIEGSRNVDIFFYKEVIKHLEYEIYGMLYANEMVTYRDVDPKTKRELSRSTDIVTWREYNLNPQKFLFEYKQEQLDETYESKREALKSTNKHMVEKFNKIERLSTYQYRFFDLISRFKQNGKWDVKGLLKELNEGYLGRNFVITAVKNFSEEEINLLTPKTLMDEITPPDLQDYIDVDNIKGMKDVSLKIINIKDEEALSKLLDYMEANQDSLLGFTTKYDLININKINYSGYEMPKSGSRLYNAIVGYQKFMMLLNPGFILRNIMDAVQRNYALVFQKGIIDGPMDFIREGKRTMELEHIYGGHLNVATKSITEIKSFYDELKADWSTPESVKMSVDNLRAKLEYQLENLNNYKNNILDKVEDESIIKIIEKTIEDLSIIKFQFDSKDFSNNKSQASDLAKQYAQSYMRMGFLSNIIAESDKMDFNNKSQENIQKVKDEIYFMNLINGIENSEVMSDRYKSKLKQEFYDKFDEEIETFAKQGIIYQGLDKLYNSKHNYFGMFNDKVERWQRLHGVLLDMRVNGLTKIESYNQSLRRFFNYGKRSNVEEAATAFFPFASFAIRNLDYSLEMMGNMKYMRMISNIMQGMRAMYNDEEEDNEFASPFYNFLVRSNGWMPITNNSSLKTSRALFEGMEIIDNPFEATYQKTNPMIQQLNNLTYGKDFDVAKALGANNNIFTNAFKSVGNIATGNVNSPADVAPSIFFEDTFEKYSPKSTPTIYGDYRNLNRDLFFPDGSRRTPSRNPHTTAKNIIYKNWVNARLMSKYRRNDRFRASKNK